MSDMRISVSMSPFKTINDLHGIFLAIFLIAPPVPRGVFSQDIVIFDPNPLRDFT